MQNELNLDPVPVFDVPLGELMRQPVGVLLYGASGSGKSTLLRYLLEQTHGKIHQILIDSEGEFHTLREKFDYLLVGRGEGTDLTASVDTAAVLCQKVMQLQVSTIVDISELRLDERPRFVADFVNQLIETPSALWHPTLFVLDELRRFAPQQGDTPSRLPLSNLQALGRKRGIIPVYATQDFEGVNKETVSELQNRILGTINVDIRRKRAAADFGLEPGDAKLLKQMPVGQFFVQGPALGQTAVRVQVPPTVTQKPKFGMTATPTPLSDATQSLIAQFADLEAEGGQKDAPEHNALPPRLLSGGRVGGGGTGTVKTIVRIQKEIVRVPFLTEEAQAMMRDAMNKADSLTADLAAIQDMLTGILDSFKDANEAATGAPEEAAPEEDTESVALLKPALSDPIPEDPAPEDPANESTPHGLKPSQRKIVNALASFAALGLRSVSRDNVAAFAGFSPGSGSYSENIRLLKAVGVLTYPRAGELALTESGAAIAGPVAKPATRADLHRAWIRRLSGTQGRMLLQLLPVYPAAVTRHGLAEQLGLSVTSGSFAENIRDLKTLGLLEYPKQGTVRATRLLFPEGLP